MLNDIAFDRQVVVPGEVIGGTDDQLRTVVYPLGLIHFHTMPEAVLAIFAAIASASPEEKPRKPRDLSVMWSVEEAETGGTFDGDATEHAAAVGSAVARALLAAAFPLLAACCVPSPNDVTDPSVPLAAAAWAAISIPPELLTRIREDLARDSQSQPADIPFRKITAQLVASGHSVKSIYTDRQPGATGELLPYPGWTFAQMLHWSNGADSLRANQQADAAQAVAVAIGAGFGGDEGSDSYRDFISTLRSI